MSADTHKYGYAAKGTSVVLYRNPALRHHQWYKATDWPGGLYLSPTFAGSRPGALSAACWAALMSMGESGYLAATRRILETGARIREGIRAIPGLRSMPMQATYLAWVDFAGTGMEPAEFTARVEQGARIAASHGPTFGTGGESFLRFNIATPRARVAEAVRRLQAAFADLQ
jgi:cystathionine beta-lyase